MGTSETDRRQSQTNDSTIAIPGGERVAAESATLFFHAYCDFDPPRPGGYERQL